MFTFDENKVDRGLVKWNNLTLNVCTESVKNFVLPKWWFKLNFECITFDRNHPLSIYNLI